MTLGELIKGLQSVAQSIGDGAMALIGDGPDRPVVSIKRIYYSRGHSYAHLIGGGPDGAVVEVAAGRASAAPIGWVEVKFAVQGRGEFPWDMLRYDTATFATEEDTGVARRDYAPGARVVCLRRFYQPGMRALPHAERWRSFSWEVIR